MELWERVSWWLRGGRSGVVDGRRGVVDGRCMRLIWRGMVDDCVVDGERSAALGTPLRLLRVCLGDIA